MRSCGHATVSHATTPPHHRSTLLARCALVLTCWWWLFVCAGVSYGPALQALMVKRHPDDQGAIQGAVGALRMVVYYASSQVGGY